MVYIECCWCIEDGSTHEPMFKVQHTDRHLTEKEEISGGTLSIFYNYNYLIWCKAFSHTFIKAVFTLWFFFSNIFSACKLIIERWHVDGISTKIEHLSQNLRDSSKISEIRGSQHDFTSKIRCHFADTEQNCKYSGILENYKLNSFISDSFFQVTDLSTLLKNMRVERVWGKSNFPQARWWSYLPDCIPIGKLVSGSLPFRALSKHYRYRLRYAVKFSYCNTTLYLRFATPPPPKKKL